MLEYLLSSLRQGGAPETRNDQGMRYVVVLNVDGISCEEQVRILMARCTTLALVADRPSNKPDKML